MKSLKTVTHQDRSLALLSLGCYIVGSVCVCVCVCVYVCAYEALVYSTPAGLSHPNPVHIF